MDDGGMLISLLPFLLVSAVLVAFSWPLCRRKGKDLVYAFLCIIPLVGWLLLIYLASLPDKAVLDRLAALEAKR